MINDPIIKNSVKCNKCGQVITSNAVAHKVSCKCGNVSISGGREMLVREGQDYTELTQYMLTEVGF
jgi:Zn finger protein HypA/HybF involved in hydrogenase expression